MEREQTIAPLPEGTVLGCGIWNCASHGSSVFLCLARDGEVAVGAFLSDEERLWLIDRLRKLGPQ